MLELLEVYAEQRDVSLLDVAIGGLLIRPVISSVIAGATEPDQVRANVAAAEWEPSDDDVATLNDLLRSAGISSRGARLSGRGPDSRRFFSRRWEGDRASGRHRVPSRKPAQHDSLGPDGEACRVEHEEHG